MSKLETSARALAAIGLAAFALFAPISIAGMQIGLGIALAGILLAWMSGIRPQRTPLDLPLALFTAAALVSTLLSREGPGSPATFTLWRHCLGFWIVSQSLALAPDATRSALRAVLLAALGLAASSIVGLVQFRSGVDVVHALGLRETARLVAAPGVPGRFAAMGFFISRLTFGHNAMVLVALFAGAVLFGALPGRSRLALAATCTLAVAAIVLTFDRAAWLGFFAAALALFAVGLTRARRSKRAHRDAPTGSPPIVGIQTIRQGASSRRLQLGIAVAACALLCVAAASVPGVRARFASGFDVQQNADRVFLWSRALEIIRDHPLAGIGFGNYPRVCPRYYDRVDPTFPMRTWAHNSVLSLWAETGPLGMLALLFLLVRLAQALRARLRANGTFAAGAMAAAASLFVVAQVHDVVYDSKVMYPLWFALALGLQPRLDERLQAHPQDASGPRS